MAGGNYSRRISVHSDDELGVLAHAFNNMGQHIEQNLHQISEVKNRLEAILSNTVNGIMLIGHDGRLIYANPAAVALLGLGEDFIGRNYTESIAAYELLCMIDEAKVSLQSIKRSIVLHTRGGNIAEANVVPIINNGVSSQDILLVLNDITEMKRLEQVRKDFVANVSHELKTPVSAISGFAETLLDEGISDQFNAVEFTRIIYDEAQRLTHLINSLLTLSKLESEPVSLNMQIIDLNSLMATTAARMNNLAGLKNITINYYDRGEAANLKSDPELIEQIMINLLDNAIKYSSEGNIIELILEESADRVIIKVKDHGTGIPAAELPRIFERFYRVDKARSRKTGGSGLGLAIVKHLVENLHGQIAVESTIGTGTVFSVTLFKQ
jgi:two-component system phosphate regulon sensor histidine kinase PhoR